MIKTFEAHTHKLTPRELFAIGYIKSLFKKGRTITGKEIAKNVLIHLGFNLSPPRVRAVIHYIRVSKLIKNLIATQKGYKAFASKKEVQTYVTSLEQRVNSINEIIRSFEIGNSTQRKITRSR